MKLSFERRKPILTNTIHPSRFPLPVIVCFLSILFVLNTKPYREDPASGIFFVKTDLTETTAGFVHNNPLASDTNPETSEKSIVFLLNHIEFDILFPAKHDKKNLPACLHPVQRYRLFTPRSPPRPLTDLS